ncbi:MAG: glycine--tRNA ligase subunit beta [Dissulfurispiraceae bacterium]|jgi:glycyl-tRNA synthetase beta chain|nr:glycine--tRNA ligase subunit beta [Dissulfurispiraceae bacterium]
MNSTSNNFPLLLFEIGTEEIPSRFIPEAVEKLKNSASRLFEEHRIQAGTLNTYATPRRLTLLCELSDMQNEAEIEFWGPPCNVAFDSDGKPTRAAEAFAASHGIDVSDLMQKEKNKGKYLVALKKETAKKTPELLPELLKKLILMINLPKSMKWGCGTIKFIRPIQWILATYNNKKIDFEIEGIRSSANTRGHRFLSPASFEVKDAAAYISQLRNNFVTVDPDERRRIIIQESEKLASSVNATLIKDDALINHVTHLVEYPSPLLASFSEEYLSLPKELLITVMKDHQKYFSLEDAKSMLSNNFIVVSNTKKENSETVRKGAERVLRARFEDARFYFEDDAREGIKNRLDALKVVIYHEKIGTLYEKCLRISSTAKLIADKCCPLSTDNAKTAALYCKADLISGVVSEFPELQGIMGGYYAVKDGFADDICKAISEHYLPTFSGDRMPSTDTGSCVSLADKLDNLVSFFAAGMMPTSAEDPFALRRQAIGTISILLEKGFNITLKELVSIAVSVNKKASSKTKEDLISFFEQRIEPLFLSAGFTTDEISAVIAFASSRPLHTLRHRLTALRDFKQKGESASFLMALKRINNIVTKERSLSPKKSLFSLAEEEALYSEITRTAPLVKQHMAVNNYSAAIEALFTLRDPVNNFFDKVLVMDKDESIKNNRLALLKKIQAVYMEIADFSKLA